MTEIFEKNNYYYLDEILELGLGDRDNLTFNLVQFKKDDSLFLFEIEKERLKSTFRFRFMTQYKKEYL